MTSIKTTKQSVHMNVWSTENIDVSKVYTRTFFDAFNFQNYRVYIRNVDGTLNDSPLEAEDSKEKKFSDVLGEEQTPNGYTNLPLEIDSSDDENEMGMIDTVTQYISRFKRVMRTNHQIRHRGVLWFRFHSTLNHLLSR
jgi:hypothetical protein